MKGDKTIIKGENKDYEKIIPGKTPADNFKTTDGFTKWYDQKSWGTKKGSLGLVKQTVGKIMGFQDFTKEAEKLQSK